jgi:hypothetical protein
MIQRYEVHGTHYEMLKEDDGDYVLYTDHLAEITMVTQGNFTQICSYCGIECEPPNGWEELQAHILVCPQHPLSKALAKIAEKDKELESKEKALDNNESTIRRLSSEIARLKGLLGEAEHFAIFILEECDEWGLAYDAARSLIKKIGESHDRP